MLELVLRNETAKGHPDRLDVGSLQLLLALDLIERRPPSTRRRQLVQSSGHNSVHEEGQDEHGYDSWATHDVHGVQDGHHDDRANQGANGGQPGTDRFGMQQAVTPGAVGAGVPMISGHRRRALSPSQSPHRGWRYGPMRELYLSV